MVRTVVISAAVGILAAVGIAPTPTSAAPATACADAGRLAAAGYARGAFEAGETLGRSVGRSATPAQRVAGWLADGPTRRLLLARPFRDVGIGVAVAGREATYVVDVAVRHRLVSPRPRSRSTP